MPRLIDADEVAKDIAWLNEYDFVIWHDVMERIDKQPTVDAVEVVRCKDCIHRMEDGMCEYKDHRVFVQDDNDFCSWGERREDG